MRPGGKSGLSRNASASPVKIDEQLGKVKYTTKIYHECMTACIVHNDNENSSACMCNVIILLPVISYKLRGSSTS